ncbi:hypothetical protein JXB01_04145, partial [Candidatus Micrarchaeota archaeon]|nr:hypothetical protein [Candidatus Micrarchaeota archaeon]
WKASSKTISISKTIKGNKSIVTIKAGKSIEKIEIIDSVVEKEKAAGKRKGRKKKPKKETFKFLRKNIQKGEKIVFEYPASPSSAEVIYWISGQKKTAEVKP